MQRAALAGNAVDDHAAASIPSSTAPCEMDDAYHWLAALRLDRAAAAVAESD